ncbi:hypothetical protein SteCoe_8766 [Stentor coeruleus]|uniref:Uncharacterized protein n=1 Tax=Stentor coeruleus TaxID=5963 RepID=A0A1R2CJE8_9CILI|nr:hypothetical protein SteCoe_8766 [Stentor coeruleus]
MQGNAIEELAYMKFLLNRPISKPQIYKETKQKLDKLLIEGSNEKLNDFLLSISQFAEEFKSFKDYIKIYENFVRKIQEKSPYEIPYIHKDYYLSSGISQSSINKMIIALDYATQKTLAHYFTEFQTRKSVRTILAGMINRITKSKSKLLAKQVLLIIKKYIISVKYSWRVSFMIILKKTIQVARYYKMTKVFERTLEKIVDRVKKNHMDCLSIKVKIITNHYVKIAKALSKVFYSIHIKSKIKKCFFKIKKSVIRNKFIRILSKSLFNKMRIPLRILASEGKFLAHFTGKLEYLYTQSARNKITSLVKYSKNYWYYHKFMQLVNRNAKLLRVRMGKKILTKTFSLQMTQSAQHVLRFYLTNNKISNQVSKLSKHHQALNHLSSILSKHKLFYLNIVKNIEKYYSFPFTNYVKIHNLNSENTNSSAKSFKKSLIVAYDQREESVKACLRAFSVIDSCIENQRHVLKDVEKENDYLEGLLNATSLNSKKIETEIKLLEEKITYTRCTASNSIDKRKNIENLRIEYKSLCSLTESMAEEFKSLLEEENNLDQDIKELSHGVLIKRKDAMNLDAQLQKLDYNYGKKCEEKNELIGINEGPNKRVNLSPINHNRIRNNYYRDSPISTSPKRVSPIRTVSPKRVSPIRESPIKDRFGSNRTLGALSTGYPSNYQFTSLMRERDLGQREDIESVAKRLNYSEEKVSKMKNNIPLLVMTAVFVFLSFIYFSYIR